MKISRTSSVLELLVQLDRASPEPLHRQLEHGLRGAVRDGRLAPASPLPSSRVLADQLAVSRGIVVEAYEQLVAEGYLASRPGGATRVARSAGPVPVRRTDLTPPSFAYEFRSGRPDVSEFPRAVWLRSMRRELAEAPRDPPTYLIGLRRPAPRSAPANHLKFLLGKAALPAHLHNPKGFSP